MAQYTPIFEKPYENGYENLPSQNTPITAETLNDKDDAIVNIESYLSGNDIPSDAEGLSYDNTDSGLTADDVQGAVDELADEKLGVDEFASSVDVITNTTGQFSTITGGLMESCVVTLSPVQSGSGTPSPSNVRPITGHSSVEVGNVGKNILLEDFELGTINGVTGQGTPSNDYIRTVRTFPIDASKTYYCYSEKNSATFILYYDSNDNYLGTSAQVVGANTQFQPNVPSATRARVTFNQSDYTQKRMICLNSETDKSYEPYNPSSKQYTISLGQTVYGGSLDVVSGVLTVDKGIATISDFTSNISGDSGGGLRFVDSSTLTNFDNTKEAITSMLPYYSTAGTGWMSQVPCCSHNNTTPKRLRIFCTENTKSDFNTAYADIKVVYPLETPITIQLTPQQIETLIGQNNVSVPLTGQSLDELTYREVMAWDDVERAVNVKLDLSSVAPIEYTDKASQSYNQKQLFIKDNKLCQALASISSGASFTENTNFKYTTLAEIIEPLIP